MNGLGRTCVEVWALIVLIVGWLSGSGNWPRKLFVKDGPLDFHSLNGELMGHDLCMHPVVVCFYILHLSLELSVL